MDISAQPAPRCRHSRGRHRRGRACVCAPLVFDLRCEQTKTFTGVVTRVNRMEPLADFLRTMNEERKNVERGADVRTLWAVEMAAPQRRRTGHRERVPGRHDLHGGPAPVAQWYRRRARRPLYKCPTKPMPRVAETRPPAAGKPSIPSKAGSDRRRFRYPLTSAASKAHRLQLR